MNLINQIKGVVSEQSPTQEVNDPWLEAFRVKLLIKRDDLIHPIISGNKWRKLRHNLTQALNQDHHTLLTFGGAYSNHIAATAYAAKGCGLDSIGVIRGEDDPNNPTLKQVREWGMQLHFVDREAYRDKTKPEFQSGLSQKFGRFYSIPEGGANGLGVKGCAEILDEIDHDFDVVCCACGTATTLAGLALGVQRGQRLIGFPAVKGGEFLRDEAIRLMAESGLRPKNATSANALELNTSHHFGGYAKVTDELLEFIQGFQERTSIELDPIYTGKMMFGIYEMVRAGEIAQGTTILAIHTGGLQGWDGMRQRGLV